VKGIIILVEKVVHLCPKQNKREVGLVILLEKCIHVLLEYQRNLHYIWMNKFLMKRNSKKKFQIYGIVVLFERFEE